MNYQGDFRLESTFDVKFCTVTTTGAPTQLAGTPVISAYPGNSTTQLTAGITLSVDFDSVTGLNNVRVVATAANGYLTATNYQLVITTGTVGGTSVVGYVIGSFSIENRSAVMPTTAARTLDITATGAAGIDWGNLENPTTTVGLTNTTVGIVTLLNGLAASVITATSIATGAITAAKFAAGAIDAAAIASNAFTAAKFAADYFTSTAAAIWNALTSGLTTVGSIGKLLVDNVNATITSRASQTSVDDLPTNAELAAEIDAVQADIAGVQSDTNDIQTRLPAALVGGRMDSSVGAYASGLTPLQPTVAGRTLDVSAGGEAGLDWANIGGPTTVQGLSGTTIKTATDVATAVAAVPAAVLAAAVDGAVTVAESLRLANSANGAKASGAGTATFVLRDLADTKDRVSASVDGTGNRTAVTRDLT